MVQEHLLFQHLRKKQFPSKLSYEGCKNAFGVVVAALYGCFGRKTKNIGSVENRISLVFLPLTHDAWWGLVGPGGRYPSAWGLYQDLKCLRTLHSEAR